MRPMNLLCPENKVVEWHPEQIHDGIQRPFNDGLIANRVFRQCRGSVHYN
jgi:hypothetical protein